MAPTKTKATKRGKRGVAKQGQNAATATSGTGDTLSPTMKQSIQTTLNSYEQRVLKLFAQEHKQLMQTLRPIIGRQQRKATGQTKTRAIPGSQAKNQGQRIADAA